MICSRDTPEKTKEEKTEVMKENTLDMCFTGVIHHSKVLSADKGKISFVLFHMTKQYPCKSLSPAEKDLINKPLKCTLVFTFSNEDLL